MAKIFKYTFKHSIGSLVFIISAGIMLAAGLYEAFVYFSDYYYEEFELSQVLGERIPEFMTVLFAVLPCLLTGREMANGTVRNKIVSGISKPAFFMAHLLVNCIITVMLVFIYFLPKFIFCSRFFKHFELRFLLLAIMCMCLGYILITAVGTVVSVMSDKMAVSIVVSLGLLFAVYMGYNLIERRLREPTVEIEASASTDEEKMSEGIDSYASTNEEEWTEVYKEVHNPLYIESKALRRTLWTVQRLMPMEIIVDGHMIFEGHVASMKVYKDTSEIPKAYTSVRERHDSLFYLPIYSFGCTAAVSILGLLLFRRRNLK